MHNDYLNGWAKIFGPTGTAIYVSLCRHADNYSQKCFPSQELIARELGIHKRTVRRHLSLFEKCRLISIERSRDIRTKKRLNNVYTLLHKKHWRKPEDIVSSGKPEATSSTNQRTYSAETEGQQGRNKETNINNTNRKERTEKRDQILAETRKSLAAKLDWK